ncbi:Protein DETOXIFICATION 15 [Hirschfeldia incana]|nr:Protein DETOXIFICATION 15 [Hirschfeldia incana]
MACGSTHRSESSSVLSASNLSHVRRTSWLSSSLSNLRCHILRLRHRIQLPDGNSKCVGHSLWPVIRSKNVRNVRHTDAKSNVCSYALLCSSLHHMGQHRAFPRLLRPRLDKSIANLSGSYAKFMIPSIFAYGLLQCINRFLQAQNNVFPVVLCSGVTTCLHVFLCWFLVLKSGLWFRGAAVANSISYWLNVILLACYVKFSPSCSLTWTGFSKEALRDIIPFMKLAIPSALMVCLEMWSFELLVLSSGLLPNPVLETSVLSICLNTSGTIWMIPFGLGGAASTRVSNELGAGNAKVAKRAVRVVLSIAILESVLVGSVMILIRKIWGFAYSSDPRVVAYVASMMPILAIGHLLDSFQSIFSGVARGCGWQKIGAFVNLGSYYFVGVPLGLLLGFHFHLGGRAFSVN